jgi:hypothetical protein
VGSVNEHAVSVANVKLDKTACSKLIPGVPRMRQLLNEVLPGRPA